MRRWIMALLCMAALTGCGDGSDDGNPTSSTPPVTVTYELLSGSEIEQPGPVRYTVSGTFKATRYEKPFPSPIPSNATYAYHVTDLNLLVDAVPTRYGIFQSDDYGWFAEDSLGIVWFISTSIFPRPASEISFARGDGSMYSSAQPPTFTNLVFHDGFLNTLKLNAAPVMDE